MSEQAKFFTVTPKAEAEPEAPAKSAVYIHKEMHEGTRSYWRRTVHNSMPAGAFVFSFMGLFGCLAFFNNPGLVNTAFSALCFVIAILFTLGGIYQRLGVIAEIQIQLLEREIRKP